MPLVMLVSKNTEIEPMIFYIAFMNEAAKLWPKPFTP
jgi:hypothetical protein